MQSKSIFPLSILSASLPVCCLFVLWQLMIHCFKSWGKINLVAILYPQNPIHNLPYRHGFFFSLCLPFFCPPDTGLKPEQHSPVSKYPGAKQTKLHSFVHMTQIINPRFRVPGASQPHGLNTFLVLINFAVACSYFFSFLPSYFLEVCADTILFPLPANRARRALSEQIDSRPHIRIRRCTVVYQKPSGEFCKYHINKIVSFNTT